MTWTNKYKKSIDCNNPKGFSQKAHCQARKLRQMGKKTKSQPVNEARVDKHEVSGYVIIDGHVFRDAGKSGRSTYGRYATKDPNYVKDPKEVGMHRNYRRPDTVSFSTIADAKKWVKTQPKKSSEEIDRVHKKHADFEKTMNEDFGIAKALSPIIHRKSYKMAKKTLGDVMKRKEDSTKGPLYYAAQVAKSYPGVDAKKLASMHEETIEETIRHEGSKWNIYSKDGSKRLGSYDTEQAAKKRLRQIEYFKHMGEDAPANVAGSGAIAGLGVGPQGEPGVNMKKKRKVIPFAMFVRKKPNQ
jgi:hypothetical protein